MSLRVRAAHWFELLLPRPQLPQALDLLARAGAVELETRPASGWAPVDVEALRPMLAKAHELRQRYAPFWPPPDDAPESAEAVPAESRLTRAVAQLKDWQQAAAAHITATERLQTERGELAEIADFLAQLGADPELDFGALARPAGVLAAALFVLPVDAPLPQGVEPILVKRVIAGARVYALVLGPSAVTAAMCRNLGGHDARALPIPVWLAGKAPQALAQVHERLGQLDQEIVALRKLINALGDEHHIARAAAELERLQWLAEHLATLVTSEHLARITGWTLAPTPAALEAPLRHAGLAAVSSFTTAPAGSLAPTMSDNPRWARPFELFLNLAGTPAGGEADPSVLVAFIAPLMFGYMFGDVGQGLLLFVAGLLLRRRWPAAGILVPGGLLAMVFGLLFGTVFTSTRLLPALWTDPIHDPLPVLALPMAGGALLILLGLGLDALTAAWSDRLQAWLREEGGLVLIYLAGGLMLLNPVAGAWLAAAGALCFVLAPQATIGWRGLPGRLGELLERLLQLAVNTLSFIRVGAFALAHAGLSLAVAALADAAAASPPGKLAVFVAGNLLILALEGLVVGIQTTRLVLFEFFIRFVRGAGRPFRPLQPSGLR